MFSFEYLEKEGFGPAVIDALKLLTHDRSVKYMDYVRAIFVNPIARKVKLADLRHNMDDRRSDGKPFRKTGLYKEAYALLSEIDAR